MPYLPQAALLESLGWTIVNSWWQFGVLWVLFLLIKKVLPGMRSAQRYNLLIILLVTGILWSVISFFMQLNANGSGLPETNNLAADTPVYYWYEKAHTWVGLILPYISIIYLIWLTVKVLQFSGQLWFTRRVSVEGLIKLPARWRIFLENTGARMNIRPQVRLWLSESIDTPMIIGCFKPIILLPVSIISQLSPDQLEAILIHELAHIKRNDYFWNLLVALAELVFYHNPFARSLVQAIREEREHSCDDWVLQFPFIPADYANALLQLEKNRQSDESRLLLAARGNSRKVLLVRVQRMLNLPQTRQSSGSGLGILGSIAVLLGLLAMVGTGTKKIPTAAEELNGRLFFSAEYRHWSGKPSTLSASLSTQGDINGLSKNNQIPYWPEQLRRLDLSNGGLENEKNKTTVGLSRQKPGDNIYNHKAGSLNSAAHKTEQSRAEENVEVKGSPLNWATSVTGQVRVEAAVSQTVPEAKAFTHTIEKIRVPEEASFHYRLPYVPRNSFQFIQPADTLPGSAAALSNLKATEAAIQAQLALDQVNWEKVWAELKEKGASAETIRKELENSLASLNWNRIQEDARTALRKLEEARLVHKMQATLQLQHEFEKQEAELRKLHHDLDRQQEAIKKKLYLQEQELKKLPGNSTTKKKIVHI